MAQEELKMGGLRTPYQATPMQSTLINIPSEPHVPDHVVWSLFNTLFLNCCCLGVMAYVYSVKSRDQKMVGNMIGAQSHASTAKYLNIFSTVLGLLGILIFIILLATGTVMRVSKPVTEDGPGRPLAIAPCICSYIEVQQKACP